MTEPETPAMMRLRTDILTKVAKARSQALDEHLKYVVAVGYDERAEELRNNASKAWEAVAEAEAEKLLTDQ